jgi:nucleotide-binding universal stress UspA family protein
VVHVDLDGYPPDAIAGYADEVGADLIVVGSRGRGGVASLILGSTSHRLIHIAKTDVLIAREGRAAA